MFWGNVEDFIFGYVMHVIPFRHSRRAALYMVGYIPVEL